MLEQIPHPDGLGQWLVVLGIVALISWRVFASKYWFSRDATFWFVFRRGIATPLDEILDRVPIVYAKTEVRESEHIATLDSSIDELNDGLADAGYTIQMLASIAHDWLGRKERTTWARYVGPKFGEGILPEDIVDALPEWFRLYQVHVRKFAYSEHGPTTITAHHELNPWFPIPFVGLAHLFGIRLDVEKGVTMAAEDLGIELDETGREDGS